MGFRHRFLCKVIRLQSWLGLNMELHLLTCTVLQHLELQRRQGVAKKIMVVRCGIFKVTEIRYTHFLVMARIETRKRESTTTNANSSEINRLLVKGICELSPCVLIVFFLDQDENVKIRIS